MRKKVLLKVTQVSMGNGCITGAVIVSQLSGVCCFAMTPLPLYKAETVMSGSD
jgi:hypothetical protein